MGSNKMKIKNHSLDIIDDEYFDFTIKCALNLVTLYVWGSNCCMPAGDSWDAGQVGQSGDTVPRD